MIRSPFGTYRPGTEAPAAREAVPTQQDERAVGVPAPRADEAGSAAVAPPRPRTGVAALVISRGPDQGAVFPLERDTTVLGRHRDCDIVLGDVTVSRYHTEIRRDGENFAIQDAGSLNGTYLNRQVVDRAVLADGDEIWVGKVRFTFHAGS
ncbi:MULTISPECIES: FHA domain-containing protein [unclassified Saccharopolyspora]|uniref:FHA domain-containing protein n=1 Tax=unclassified Saccharopolyspora TaxID=2646250 RepID=UPI001CD69210|nr:MULTISPECIES: FHA domain-containing protein [unclassified Saccharopolyspora]MCA1187005.1 FHA domain-containing protein [Saccharopolyspora sp. 6T]MCA1195611.1 FHA domain-containing protein [Saccharopolyspora sp. 6V]MCA1224794.1 FHA domain-containing protein [Saccharopolyspora sp. 6M]MCA1280142.1 FHA domain-containing protein [Saccharopolyspora sp. 7B]